MTPDWTSSFPGLDAVEPAARRRLGEAGRRVRLPAGAEPFRAGSACENYLLMVSGVVRVQLLAENGREIVLYRVGAGETCILTTACLVSGEDYPASAVTETPVEAIVLGGEAFRELLGLSAVFREFVFRTWGRRLAGLMALLEEVAFRRLDRRLAEWLACRATSDGSPLHTTHQDIAVELGSSREVISRQLKEFERRGWVSLGRGALSVLAPAELHRLAREAPA